jgi:hypothetical protein
LSPHAFCIAYVYSPCASCILARWACLIYFDYCDVIVVSL